MWIKRLVFIFIMILFCTSFIFSEDEFSIGPASNFGGTVRAIAARDNTLFILQNEEILAYDTTNPENPLFKGSLKIEFNDNYTFPEWGGDYKLFAKGDYLYLVMIVKKQIDATTSESKNRLVIIDISDLSKLSTKSSIDLKGSSLNNLKIFVYDNYAFISETNGYSSIYDGTLDIVDVSNPATPKIKQTFKLDIGDVFAFDNKLYLTVDKGYKLQYVKVYDLPKFLTTNSDNLTNAELISYNTEDTKFLKAISASDNFIVIGSYNSSNGVTIFKVNNDNNTLDNVSSIKDVTIKKLCIDNNTLYLATDNKFLIYNITQDEAVLKSSLNIDTNWFVVNGNYVYLLPRQYHQWGESFSENPDTAFQIIDVTNLEAPIIKYKYYSPKNANSAIPDGNKLFVADQYSLFIYSLTNPGTPVFEKYIVIDKEKEINKIAVDDNYIYVTFVPIGGEDNITDELRILDKNNPENIVAHYYTTNYKIYNLFIDNNKCILFIKNLDEINNGKKAYIRILDISNIPNITQIGEDILFQHRGKSIFVKNNKIYIGGFDKTQDFTADNTSITIYDFSNINNIIKQNIPLDVFPSTIYVTDENLFVGGVKSNCINNNCEFTYGIYIYNLNDLSDPIAIVDNETGQLWDMKVLGSLIFLGVNGKSTIVYNYDKTTNTIEKKGECHSPGSIKTTVTQGANGEGYVYSVEDKVNNIDAKYYLYDESLSCYSGASMGLYCYPMAEGYEGVYIQKFKTTPPAPSPILTLGGQAIYKEFFVYTDTKKGDNVTIAKITLTADEVSDWQVNSVTFHGYGCGNEQTDIKKARLYFGSVGGELLGEATYSSDNGTISFNVNKKITKGSSITLVLEYEMKYDTCPCRDYKIHIDMSDVSAEALENPPGKKLPVPPNGVDSGPAIVKPGDLYIVSGNEQWGEKEQPLPEPFKVKVEKEYLPCVDYIEFEIISGSKYGAKLQSTGGLKSQIKVDVNGEAEETLILGDKSGKKYPYQVSAFIVQKDKCSCNFSTVLNIFTAWGEGLDVTAKHDGKKGDDKFSTFISNIKANNKFTATINVDPKSDVKIKEVTFEFEGESEQGKVVVPNKIYEATFDMSNASQSSNLKVTAIEESGKIFDEVEVPIEAIDYPSWVASLSKISENIKHEFDDKDEKYIIGFEYPTNFIWKDLIPGDIGLLGGLDFDLPFEFHVTTEYNIDETSGIEAGANGELELFGQEIEWEGSLTGSFDEFFEFKEGTGTISAKTKFDLPEKGYSKTFVVYGVPITVAVDLGGNVEIFVDGEIVLNNKLQFQSAKVTPGTTVTGEITISLSAVFGLAKIAATGEPSVTVKIEISYTNDKGTTTKWGGKVVVPIKVVGSIFWGLGSAELYSTELGPWTFGNLAVASANMCYYVQTSSITVPDLISSSSVARDEAGNIMQVWIGDTDNQTGSVNPDVYFRYFNGQVWSAPAPIIGDNSPNNFWEMDPFVVSIGDGKFLAAWTSNDGDKSLDNLNDIFAHQDIMYSVWNGVKWSDPEYIFNDAEGDGSVFLSFDKKNNQVISVWLHDKNSDKDINTRNEWELMYSIYDIENNIWSNPQVITYTEDNSADFMPALSTNNNGETVLVWIKDIDGKFFNELDNITNGTNVDYTNPDSNVIFSKYENGVWSDPVSITNPDNMSEVEPSVKISANGNVMAAWISKDGVKDKLMYSLWNGSEWTSPILITESEKFIENPRLLIGDNISISWTKTNMKSNVDYAGEGLRDGINYKVISVENKPCIVYRGYNGYDGELYYTVYYQDNMSWSTPDNITSDELVDWNVSAATYDNSSYNIEYKKPEKKVAVNKGWQLVAIPVVGDFNTGEKFTSSTTIWGWSGSNWEVWSGKDSIISLLNQYKITILSELKQGKGYWLNSSEEYEEIFNGTAYGKEGIVLEDGWNLVGCGEDIQASEFAEAKTLWQWSGSNWKVWSPLESIITLLNQYKIDIVDGIKAGEGFWINK